MARAAWIQHQPDEFLLCRDTGIRHSWEPHTVDSERRFFIETLVCKRCGALKVRTLTRAGFPVKTKIKYPDGFLRVGIGRMSKTENAQVRAEHLNRHTNRHAKSR